MAKKAKIKKKPAKTSPAKGSKSTSKNSLLRKVKMIDFSVLPVYGCAAKTTGPGNTTSTPPLYTCTC